MRDGSTIDKKMLDQAIGDSSFRGTDFDNGPANTIVSILCSLGGLPRNANEQWSSVINAAADAKTDTEAEPKANSRTEFGADSFTYCICNAPADDITLVQCDKCGDWVHPACQDKSVSALQDNARKRYLARASDVQHYASRPFTCRSCDA
jgi:hypothetical protein